MGKRFGGAALANGIALAMLAPGAGAAVEVGNKCGATWSDARGDAVSVLQTAAGPGHPLPLAAPADGVLTGWSSNVVSSGPFTPAHAMQVLRPTVASDEFVLAHQSAEHRLSTGANSFPARVPVRKGDRFALVGSSEDLVTYLCAEDDRTEYLRADPPFVVDAGLRFDPGGEHPVPLWVTIEPDADGDGYGDETQDRCPRDAAIQAVGCPLIAPLPPLPPVALDAYAVANRASVSVFVTADTPTTISVRGRVTVPGMAIRSSRGIKRAKPTKLTLDGGRQKAGPGKLARATLKFPARLKRALAQLPRKRSLILTVTSSAANADGRLSSHDLLVRLKGKKTTRANRKR